MTKGKVVVFSLLVIVLIFAVSIAKGLQRRAAARQIALQAVCEYYGLAPNDLAEYDVAVSHDPIRLTGKGISLVWDKFCVALISPGFTEIKLEVWIKFPSGKGEIIASNLSTYTRSALLNANELYRLTRAGCEALPAWEKEYGPWQQWSCGVHAAYYDAFGYPVMCSLYTLKEDPDPNVYVAPFGNGLSEEAAADVSRSILLSHLNCSEENLDHTLRSGYFYYAKGDVNDYVYRFDYYCRLDAWKEQDYIPGKLYCMFRVLLRASDGKCFSAARYEYFPDEFNSLGKLGEDAYPNYWTELW